MLMSVLSLVFGDCCGFFIGLYWILVVDCLFSDWCVWYLCYLLCLT